MKKFLLTTALVSTAACSSQDPAPVVGGLFGDKYRVVNTQPYNAQTMPIQNLAPIASPNAQVSALETVDAQSYRVATLQEIEPAAGPILTDASTKDFGSYRLTHNRDYSSASNAVASAQQAVNNLTVAAQPATQQPMIITEETLTPSSQAAAMNDIFTIQPAAGPVTETGIQDYVTPTALPTVHNTVTTGTPAPTQTAAQPTTTPVGLINTTDAGYAESYVAKEGDTLQSIARQFGTDTAMLQEINNLPANTVISLGDILMVPSNLVSPKVVATNTTPTTTNMDDIFAIQPAAGPVTTPVVTATPAPSAAAETYVVSKGDTLYSLSRRFNTKVGTLMEMNSLNSPQQLTAGDMIMVPSSRIAAATPAPVTTDVFAIQPANGPVVTAPVAPQAPTVTPVQTITTQGYTMAKGDTLYSLSKRFGTDVNTLMQINNVTNPADMAIGQVIRVPNASAGTTQQATTTPAAMTTIQPAAGTTNNQGFNSPDITMATHTVSQGENLYRIGLKYKVSVIDLMAANDLDVPQDLKSGMTIKVPLASTQAAVVRQTTSINQAAARAKGMVWPAKGPLLSSFGEKGNGVTHTGVAIKLPENTPVMAAEAGEVIYANNGLKSYGNLVLVRHSDGLVTAYAHNNSLSVKKGDNVVKGQTIALSGATGNVTVPQLHFEVRRNARAIDPKTVLPKS